MLNLMLGSGYNIINYNMKKENEIKINNNTRKTKERAKSLTSTMCANIPCSCRKTIPLKRFHICCVKSVGLTSSGNSYLSSLLYLKVLIREWKMSFGAKREGGKTPLGS